MTSLESFGARLLGALARSEVPEPDYLINRLGAAVQEQWTRAAAERGLLEPEPIPVRWRAASVPIAGPPLAAAHSHRFMPLPGVTAVQEKMLRTGDVLDLYELYAGLGSGRLVIAGPPGSGKSSAAILLVLTALRQRTLVPQDAQRYVPVPVLFTFHGWDPVTQPIEDWLAVRLNQTYPLFAGNGGAVQAAELLATGKIAVILDGLDEIPQSLRSVALRALNQQATFRLVILSRSAELAETATHVQLEGAAAIELQDVDPATAADYLARSQLYPPPSGWRELIAILHQDPESPLAQALRSPLALALVRDTYRGADDVRELIDFVVTPGHNISREDIEDHLLDRVLPAAYVQRPGSAPPLYDLQTAKLTLSYIAMQMSREDTRDLEWWRISAWAPASPRIVTTGLIAALGFGLGAWIVTAPVYGTATAVVAVLAAGLAGGIAGALIGVFGGRRPPMRIRLIKWRPVFRLYSIAIGVAAGLLAGFLSGPAIGLVAGIVAGSGTAMAGGFSRWEAAGGRTSSLVSPTASWRSDRSCGLAIGLAAGLVAGLVSGLIGGFAIGLTGGLAVGLAAGLVIGLTIGLIVPRTWSTALAFVQLARRRHTPIRLLRFLEDARYRDVLRTNGPAYQFRHLRLQDRLTKQ